MSAIGEVLPVEAPPIPEVKGKRSGNAPTSKVGRNQEKLAWIMLFPSLLIVFVVALYPLIETFRLSLTTTRLASARAPKYIGLDNYTNTLHNSLWWSSFWHTVNFTIWSVAFETVLGMVIALVINSHFRGRGLVRTAILIPWAIPTVVSATMWQWMYHDVFGVVNDLFVNRLH
ncbi:MAG: carbohydrate ABC transporter permease, partial [Thermomicrobiales bacterium]